MSSIGCTLPSPDELQDQRGLDDGTEREFYRGSWRAPIKSSSPNPADRTGCAPQSWASDDPTEMINALLQTGQNLYISSLNTNLDSCYWDTFARLVDAVDDRGEPIQVWAALPDAQALSLDDFAELVAAVNALTAPGSSLRALTIDDFGSMVQLPHDMQPETRWGREEVATLQAEMPDLDFMPYISAETFGQILLPGHILGVRGCWSDCDNRYDNFVFPGDTIAMSFDYNPGRIKQDEELFLSFLIYDEYRVDRLDTKDLELVIYLNGEAIERRSVFEEPGLPSSIEEVSVRLTGLIDARTDNAFTFALEAVERPTNNYNHKLVHLWDVGIHRGKRTTRTEPIPAASVRYTLERDPTQTLSDSTAQMFASSNEAFRIDAELDGAILGYDVDKLYFSSPYYRSIYERLVQATCAHLHDQGKRCIVGHWGSGLGVETLDRAVQAERLAVAQDVSDGSVIWRFPLALEAPTAGIFAERAPIDSETYDRMAYYPPETPSEFGWYQRWRHAVEPGRVVLEWNDNRENQSSLSGRFVKFVRFLPNDGGPEQTFYLSDVNDETSEGWKRIDIPSPGTLEVGMQSQDGVGNAPFWFQFRVGIPRQGPLTDWTYQSGVDPDHEAMFRCYKAFYTGIAVDTLCRGEPYAL